MPSGIYKRVKSLCRKEKIKLDCQVCGVSIFLLESIIKRGRGKFCSKQCKNISLKKTMLGNKKGFKKGQEAWNKNITGENSHSFGRVVSKDTKLKLKAISTGYKHTEEARKKIREKRAKQVITEKHKESIKEAAKNNPNYGMRGKTISQKGKEKLRIWNTNNPNRVFKDTKPELRMEALLKSLGVEYQKQVPLFNIARVDFYVPSKNLVIQCDGCFWHGCPIHNPNWTKSQERDANQDKVLQENGLIVVRFWEHEIMSPNFRILMLHQHGTDTN